MLLPVRGKPEVRMKLACYRFQLFSLVKTLFESKAGELTFVALTVCESRLSSG